MVIFTINYNKPTFKNQRRSHFLGKEVYVRAREKFQVVPNSSKSQRELGGIYGPVNINIRKAVISVMNSLILKKLDENKFQKSFSELLDYLIFPKFPLILNEVYMCILFCFYRDLSVF